ncbi:hypothetical protein [Capybara microvirus Cap3_SP_478]|nr:hypothetical protein [Capybara microvirus Cap3_SP_478]
MAKKINFKISEYCLASSYEEDSNNLPYTQSFNEVEDEWALNEKTGDLEVVGKINVQEQIQSFDTCALDKILDKFLSGQLPEDYYNVSEVNTIYDATVRNDLARLGDLYAEADKLKQKYDLDPTLDARAVFEFVANKANENTLLYDNKIKEYELNEKNKIAQES